MIFPKTRWLMVPSTMIIDRPAKMLDTKNRIGMNSEYQSGWIFGLAIRKSAPRPD